MNNWLTSRSWLFPCFLILLERIALGVVGAHALPYAFGNPAMRSMFEPFSQYGQSKLLWQIVNPWQRLDMVWYEQIATHGYVLSPSAAFSPLFPALIWLVGKIVSTSLAALCLSTIATSVALIRLQQLVTRHLTPEDARWTILMLIAFPSAFFLLSGYPDSLLLLIVIEVMTSLEFRQWWNVTLWLSAAVLVRDDGILLLGVVGICITYEWWKTHHHVRNLAIKLPVLAIPTGFWLCYEVIVGRYAHTFGSLGAERFWGAHLSYPGSGFLATIQNFMRAQELQAAYTFVGLVFLVVGTLGLYVRKVPFSWWLFLLLEILLNGSLITNTHSLIRFVLIMFPIFVAAGTWIANRSAVIRYGILTISFFLQMLMFTQYVRFAFVG